MDQAPPGRDRRPLLIGIAIAIAIAVVAIFDFRNLLGEIPGVPPPCPLGDAACDAARNEVFPERIDTALELDAEYRGRSWLYAAGALVSVLAGFAVAYARTAPERRRELFTDLGVTSVLWLVGGVVAELTAARALVIDVPTKAIFYPGLALAGLAAAGTLLTWSGPGRDPPAEVVAAARFEGRAIQAFGLGLTAIAVLIAVIAVATAGGCENDDPAWLETLVEICWFVAGAAAVMGLLSLLQRRWISALVLLGVGPFVALIAALSIACLS